MAFLDKVNEAPGNSTNTVKIHTVSENVAEEINCRFLNLLATEKKEKSRLLVVLISVVGQCAHH